MEYGMDGNRLVINLTGKIDAGNAPDVEDQINEILGTTGATDVVLDASELEYISSAGLRVMVKLLKRLSSLIVVEASPSVYEVFEMTGFTQMMEVRRALRTIDVAGCECIGRGGNGAVYRLDAETIVKVYHNDTNSLEKVQASRVSAQKLMAYGIPVAIAFDVVKVVGGEGLGYGLVYELLDCKTVGELIHEDPSSAEKWAHEAAALLKLLHTTEVPEGTFPDARDSGHQWVEVAKDVLSKEDQARLHRLYDSLPAKNTLVHGDFHTGNMMVQGGEIVLIDTDDVAQGDPIIDMAGLALTFEYITTDDRAMDTLRMTVDEMHRYYDALLKDYYGTDDEALLQRYAYQRKLHSLVKLLYGLVKTDAVPEPMKSQVIAQMRGGLLQLMNAMGI
ncbi:MAG: anti-sigma factor antagonist [Coriobacteriales bacterium]|nr:anti-sigma factor antagonist [Coriobacteriales bacterium]